MVPKRPQLTKPLVSDLTERKHRNLIPFKPGQSGNPRGRPKGARNKLGERFLGAIFRGFAYMLARVYCGFPVGRRGLVLRPVMKTEARLSGAWGGGVLRLLRRVASRQIPCGA